MAHMHELDLLITISSMIEQLASILYQVCIYEWQSA